MGTPLTNTNWHFYSKVSKNERGVKVNSTFYKQIVGGLMYFIAIRPDLIFIMSHSKESLEGESTLIFSTIREGVKIVSLCQQWLCVGDIEDDRST